MSTSTSTETEAGRLEETVARIGKHARHQQRGVLLELLAEIIAAETWDEEVYDVRPADDWVLIRRESWSAIHDIAEAIDSWRPWGHELGDTETH